MNERDKLADLIGCINKMWLIFSKVVSGSDETSILGFMEAKDEAHGLIAELAGMGKERRAV